MSINIFDAIYYINLKHRKDRKKQILSELKKAGAKKEKIFRIEAVFNPLNGHLGCAMSHIKALNTAKEKKIKNVLILEDDCHFFAGRKNIDKYIDHFFNTVKTGWDVFFLGTRVVLYKKTTHPKIVQILASTHSHAYAVNNRYFTKLLECFTNAEQELKKILFYFQVKYETIDFKWNFLQIRDKWFMLENMIAEQRRSFSDIGQNFSFYSLKEKSKKGIDAGKLSQTDLFGN